MEDEIEVDSYTINDQNYILIDKIDDYLYLVNEDNEEDMLIQKEDPNDEEVLLPLKNEEEYKIALMKFTAKALKEEN